MFAVFISIGWKILQWSLMTAAVLVYIEIGPGGDSLDAIVSSLKEILLGINWGTLISEIFKHIQNLVLNLWDIFLVQLPGKGKR